QMWKSQGLLAPYLPEELAKNYPSQDRDGDATYAVSRSTLCIIAYNTTLVKPGDAPKSFADLLDPKWAGRLVKAHPSYSGTIITSTYQMVRVIGWPYFEKLAKQKVMQVQSATDTPKKVVLGERPVMIDGNEYNVLSAKESGKPIEPVYAPEGSPVILNPSAIFTGAPHPNAARLFHSWLFSPEAQQIFVEVGGMRSLHRAIKDPPGRRPLADIKLMNVEPDAMLGYVDDIKRRYSEIFGV